MALKAVNSSRLGGDTNRRFSGTTTVVGGHGKRSIGVPHTHLNWSAGWHAVADVTDRSSAPEGARHPVAFRLARKAGGLASRSEGNFAFALGTLNLAEGRNLEADTTITWSVPDAQLQLVVSASGSADFAFTVPNAVLSGALSAEGATTFAFSVGTATLGAIVDALASAGITFTGSGTATALGWIEGDITPFTELSPQNLAQSVLDAVIEDDVNLADVLRILLAHASGDATDLDSNPAFKSHDGTKTRLAGTISGGDRTITTFDPT